MAKALRDSSTLINANSALSNAKQTSIATDTNARLSSRDKSLESLQKSYELSQKSLDLNQESIDNARFYNNAEFGLNLLKLGIDTYNTVVQSQGSDADKDNTAEGNKWQQLFNESLVKGTSYYDDNGNFVIDPELQDNYETYIASIDETHRLGQVKKYQKESAQAMWQGLVTDASASALKTYATNLENNFQAGIQSDLQSDVQAYVAAGGDLFDLNEDYMLKGIARIGGRTDWNPSVIKAKQSQYLDDMMKLGDQEIATNIALSEGKQAAFDYVYGDGNSFSTTEEKNNAYSKAIKALDNRMASVKTSSESMMEDAMVNGSATPVEVYKSIAESLSGEPKEVIDAANEAAKKKQKEIINAIANNTFVRDKGSGLASLEASYGSLMSGGFDAYFYGIEDTKATVANMYQAEISAEQKAIATATATTEKAVESAKKQVVTTYQDAQKETMQKFDDGVITGEQAVAEFIDNAAVARASINGTKKDSTGDTWTEEILDSANAFLDEITDAYIPSKYKTQMTSAFNLLKASAKLNKTESSMTTDQRQAVRDANTFFYGRIADYIYENGADMTPDDFAAFADQEASSLAFVFEENSPWKTFLDGTKIDGSTQTAIKRQFLSANSMAWEKTGNDMLFYLDYAYGDARSEDPKVQYATEGVSVTYGAMIREVAKQVSWITGDETGVLETTAHMSDDNGRLVLSPTLTATDGTQYRVGKNNTIEVFAPATLPSGAKDYSQGQWIDTKITPANTKEEMQYKLHQDERYDDARKFWNFVKEGVSEGKLLSNTVEAVVSTSLNAVKNLFSGKPEEREPEAPRWTPEPARGGSTGKNKKTMVVR